MAKRGTSGARCTLRHAPILGIAVILTNRVPPHNAGGTFRRAMSFDDQVALPENDRLFATMTRDIDGMNDNLDPNAELSKVGKPSRRSVWQRMAREGTRGRFLFDSTMGAIVLITFATSAIHAGGTTPPVSSRGAGGLPAEFRQNPLTRADGFAAAAPSTDAPYSFAAASTDAGAQAGPPAPPGTDLINLGRVVTSFGCDVPADHYCAFTLFRSDGTSMAFGLKGGQRAGVSVSPNVDRYIVTVDAPARTALDQCPVVQAQGHFCKVAVAKRGFNN